ncbi:MAG: NUDIX hydrolase [Kofleriaceae bacterium]|nr:NUDIX hydrolase [Kofleriaceae bacterium]MCL4223665.1 NUDIX hydrolase [Myxococcales bacterium]
MMKRLPRLGVLGALGVMAMIGCQDGPVPDWWPPARDDHGTSVAASGQVETPPALTLDRAWTLDQTRPLVEKTLTVRLAPDLDHLSAPERAAVDKLLAVGAIMQELYEDQRHVDAAPARALVAGLDQGERAQHLRQLHRLFQGPIAATLDNQRVPFLGARPVAPGKTVYPWGITASEIEAFLADHPEARDAILAPRTVVRRAEAAALAADLATLDRHPALDTLHPGLRERLQALRAAPAGLYAVPYAVAYADRVVRVHRLLHEAAEVVTSADPELAGYLRNRARDLLTDDYESGDAAWVTADLGNLNVQLGAYETYDDELFGAKTFFALSLLARRPADSDALRHAIGGLQALEDSLPYARKKKVRERIPVGVYDVIADFGQARGGNTATILPNEAYLTRRYGRTILLRANIMRDPDLFAAVGGAWAAVMAPAHAGELTADAGFVRTLWHEVGHYLGVDATRDGRDLDAALGDTASLLEELKADLASLFVARELRARGHLDDAGLRAVYASGVNRVLQNNRPRRDQPYQTMQLMQWNHFLTRGLLRFDAATATMSIDHARYHDVVAELLARVLAVQDAGDKAAADAFIAELTTWDDARHGVIAQKLRDQQRYRYRLFYYAALGE